MKRAIKSQKIKFSTLTLLISSLAIGIPVGIASFPTTSKALCAADNMAGRWENVDANTRGITVINYIFRCNDTRKCTTDGSCTTGRGTTIKVFGARHPRDCDWGESEIKRYKTSDWRYTIYDQGFAKKVVWLKLKNNGQLRAVVQVDYRDNRKDRTLSYTFNRNN